MMRFRGGGVGHKSTREATHFFKKDRDRLDTQDKADENQVGYVSEEENAEDEEEDYGYIQDSDTESGDDSDVGLSDDFGYGDL
jgi:hypothetical protein